MARTGRSNDWGFPRWRGYGSSREAARVRLCDRAGCSEPGDCPAPKSPNNPERWYFCQRHAAEYNSGFRESAHYGWATSGDGSRSRDELRALELLELGPDADHEAVKKAWRSKAKEVHPDVRPGDQDAAQAFQALQLAYEVLRAAEERREWKG
jgi:hypothetical protein